jgi:hypothetical protein
VVHLMFSSLVPTGSWITAVGVIQVSVYAYILMYNCCGWFLGCLTNMLEIKFDESFRKK